MAKYNELAKSMMLGDESGMLKLLFDRNTRKLLGVHAIGQRATEIIHIGQAVLALRRLHRIFPRYGVQLSDARGSVQGRGARRPQQTLARGSFLLSSVVRGYPYIQPLT